jgi:hypothetical protein
MSEPADLLPIREAARLVGRSVATVRRWVADGELAAHYGPGTHPSNRPVLVSRGELAALAGATKSPHPGRPPTADPAELVAVRAALEQARVELAAGRETAEALRLVIRATEDRARDLAVSLEAERARGVGLAAELAALRERAGLPWWHRLIGLSGPSKLPGGDQ